VILRDEFEGIYDDEKFHDLYGRQGQDAVPPWRLALVTVLQFGEGLTDEQAVESVRTRIDWKYLLGLELDNDGFDASVLSEFRQRLVKHEAAERLLSIMLEALEKHGFDARSGCCAQPEPLGVDRRGDAPGAERFSTGDTQMGTAACTAGMV
jgi:transposase